MTLLLIASFLVILVPMSYAPIISDDHFYGVTTRIFSDKTVPDTGSFLGNIFSVTIAQISTFIGRPMSDLEARTLLRAPRIIAAIIKSAELVGLTYLISRLPQVIRQKKHTSPFIFILITIFYWISNPSLGHTVFWTVGSANYLFPALVAVGYLNVAFKMFNNKNTKWTWYVLLVPLALGTGMANESISPVMILFSIGMVIFSIFQKKSIKAWLVGAILNIVGFIDLYLNSIHKFDGIADYWKDVPFLKKVYIYLVDGNFTQSFAHYGFLFAAFIVIVVLLPFTKGVKKNTTLWASIFFGMGIVANSVLALAPYFELRPLHGAFIYFLISFSFLMYAFFETKDNKIPTIIFSTLAAVSVVLFSVSYVLVTKSNQNLMKQEKIMEFNIMKAKKNHDKVVKIPSWYFGKLLRPLSDQNDRYMNPDHWQQYYGYNGSIIQVDTPFNYVKSENINRKDFNVIGYFDTLNLNVNNEDSSHKSVVTLIRNSTNGATTIQGANVDVVIKTSKEEKSISMNTDNYVNLNNKNVIAGKLDGFIKKKDIKSIEITISREGQTIENTTIDVK